MNVYPEIGETVSPSTLLHEKDDTRSLGGSNLSRAPCLSHIVCWWSFFAALGPEGSAWSEHQGREREPEITRTVFSPKTTITAAMEIWSWSRMWSSWSSLLWPRFNLSATGKETWAGFSFYAAKWVDVGFPGSIHQNKQEKQKVSSEQKLVSLTAQVRCPDSAQVLVSREKTELIWGIKAKAVVLKTTLQHTLYHNINAAIYTQDKPHLMRDISELFQSSSPLAKYLNSVSYSLYLLHQGNG